MGDVGTVFMEVERSTPPDPGFLEGVRALADKHGAVLVFDECTSGFRRALGGLHLHYGVDPDMAIFGKTLGNGYAINAVIGRESVMQSAQGTFISSTFWSERIGPAAALAALAVMEDELAPERVHAIGKWVRASWSQIAHDKGLPIDIGGIPALNVFSLPDYDPAEVKTFLTNDMLSEGFLASTALYASLSHTPEVLAAYLEYWGQSLEKIAEHGPDRLRDSLPHGVAQSGFQRLN
jgi:glutamate-1-semialdehyde 2,1-aminomutase